MAFRQELRDRLVQRVVVGGLMFTAATIVFVVVSWLKSEGVLPLFWTSQ